MPKKMQVRGEARQEAWQEPRRDMWSDTRPKKQEMKQDPWEKKESRKRTGNSL